jgi:predicted peptidase
LLLLLALPAYLCYKVFIVDAIQTESQEEVKNENENIPTEIEAVEQITPEEFNAQEGDSFLELTPIINSQQAYIVVPSTIDDTNPPRLVIYSHGSNTRVTKNMDDPFMKDLQEYGKLFTQYNYIFAASNEHDESWGNSDVMLDIDNLIDWVSKEYFIQPKIYMLGFSMGGLSTMNFTTSNEELVEQIALLAPTLRSSEWNEVRIEKLMDKDIKIWHGTKDVNIPISNSTNFIELVKKYGIDIEFIKLENKTHFDIDSEYMEEILEFFNS